MAGNGCVIALGAGSQCGALRSSRLKHLARLTPGSGLEAVAAELGGCSAEVVLAALEAAATLQASLLQPAALGHGTCHVSTSPGNPGTTIRQSPALELSAWHL